MAVINRLKSVLVEKQLTGKWLAEHIGKSENTIFKWYSNKRAFYRGDSKLW